MALNYGLKISKPGQDILTATVDNQTFNSSYNSLKIWMSGSININVGGFGGGGTGTGASSVAHGLGYRPYFLGYFALMSGTGRVYFQDSYDDNQLLSKYVHGFIQADTNSVFFNVTATGNASDSFTAVCYYFILIDKGMT